VTVNRNLNIAETKHELADRIEELETHLADTALTVTRLEAELKRCNKCEVCQSWLAPDKEGK